MATRRLRWWCIRKHCRRRRSRRHATPRRSFRRLKHRSTCLEACRPGHRRRAHREQQLVLCSLLAGASKEASAYQGGLARRCSAVFQTRQSRLRCVRLVHPACARPLTRCSHGAAVPARADGAGGVVVVTGRDEGVAIRRQPLESHARGARVQGVLGWFHVGALRFPLPATRPGTHNSGAWTAPHLRLSRAPTCSLAAYPATRWLSHVTVYGARCFHRRECSPAVSWDTHPGVTQPQVYFLLTGVGAALGVFMGQLAYASGVYAVTAVTTQARGEVVPTAKTLLMGVEFAALLSAGAFLAGFTWEPVVNSLLFALAPATTDANAVFVLVLVCAFFIQGTVFFVGVQGARYLFSSLLHFEAIDPPLSSHTMTYDGTLSLSIGGAQGLFVATMTFASNPLTKTFGVQSTTGPLVGSLRGGGSMVVGFLVVQTMQNIVFPASTTWADARKKGRQQLRYTREEILLPYRTPYG
jgi:hypothetical protein